MWRKNDIHKWKKIHAKMLNYLFSNLTIYVRNVLRIMHLREWRKPNFCFLKYSDLHYFINEQLVQQLVSTVSAEESRGEKRETFV